MPGPWRISSAAPIRTGSSTFRSSSTERPLCIRIFSQGSLLLPMNWRISGKSGCCWSFWRTDGLSYDGFHDGIAFRVRGTLPQDREKMLGSWRRPSGRMRKRNLYMLLCHRGRGKKSDVPGPCPRQQFCPRMAHKSGGYTCRGLFSRGKYDILTKNVRPCPPGQMGHCFDMYGGLLWQRK